MFWILRKKKNMNEGLKEDNNQKENEEEEK